MVKIFNKSNRTFKFTNEDDTESIKVGPGQFASVPDALTGDITFRVAMAAGEIEKYNTIREADAIERAALEPAAAEPVDEAAEPAAEKPKAGRPKKV